MKWVLRATIALGFLAQLSIVFIAGNQMAGALSGHGDGSIYVALAHNIAEGRGYTFADTPTAFRAPLYPVLLAGLMRLSPSYWPLLTRLLQFALALSTAAICGRLARKWAGAEACRVTIAVVLLMPTLLYFTGELLSECLAAFIIAGFLFYLDRCLDSGSYSDVATLGLITGLAALARFNTIPFIGIAGIALLYLAPGTWRSIAMLACAFLLVLSPWVAHNLYAFNGHVLYSTHSGYAAVEGVLAPTGRAGPGEGKALDNALGWGNWSIETDTPSVPGLRDEVRLNRDAWRVAQSLWNNKRWHLISISMIKLSAFWLSTDQLLELSMVSPRVRVIRRAGVLIYWAVLITAMLGWIGLLTSRPNLAYCILLYTLVLTAAHLPLTMNTRLRAPLFDPLLGTLAGCAVVKPKGDGGESISPVRVPG